MKVIALHGDFASPEMLKRDMGAPSWVDSYYDGKGWRDVDGRIELLIHFIRMLEQPVTLVGYSRGGSVIARLSHAIPHLIACAVLYESPVKDSQGCAGKFPVLQIWNDRGSMRRLHRLDDVLESIRCWSIGRRCEIMVGTGKHMQLTPPAHGWDRSLNNRIEDWIRANDRTNSAQSASTAQQTARPVGR
jgi:pimeloyl-ACP methyl ester carboxylesterase